MKLQDLQWINRYIFDSTYVGTLKLKSNIFSVSATISVRIQNHQRFKKENARKKTLLWNDTPE